MKEVQMAKKTCHIKWSTLDVKIISTVKRARYAYTSTWATFAYIMIIEIGYTCEGKHAVEIKLMLCY